MKMMHTILAGLVMFGLVGTAAAQDSVRVRVQLIAADQEAGSSDGALSGLLPKLQRMPYKRFTQKGSRTVTLSAGKTVNAGVGGHTMNLTLESVQNGRARVHVSWMRGSASVVDITAVTQPGSPFVCGGPREGNLTWIAVFSVQ
jgi:hypothetical protein